MARLPEVGNSSTFEEPLFDDEEAMFEEPLFDEDAVYAEQIRRHEEEFLLAEEEQQEQAFLDVVWEDVAHSSDQYGTRQAVVVQKGERFHPAYYDVNLHIADKSRVTVSDFSYDTLEKAKQQWYDGSWDLEHNYITSITGVENLEMPSVIVKSRDLYEFKHSLKAPVTDYVRSVAEEYLSDMRILLGDGDDPKRHMRELMPELPEVFISRFVEQTVPIVRDIGEELERYKHLDSGNERKLAWTSPETKKTGVVGYDEETQIVMQIGDRFYPGVQTVDSRTKENELTLSSFSFASLDEAKENPYTGRHSLEYDHIYRHTQPHFMAEVPEHVISDTTTPYTYPTFELYRPEDADNRMEAQKYLDGLARIMGDSKEDFQERFPELPADFVDEFYETRQALIQQVGAELVAYQTIRTDAEKAMALADELLGYEAMRKAYLDPVTSYALQNDGAGYNREVTVFVPHGMLDEVAKSSHTSRYMTLDDAVTSYERSFRNRNEPIPWGFNDTGDAEKEGYFHAYLIQRDGEKGDGLSVHFRELERGMVKPETYVEQSRTADGEDVSLPILTGKGMVQHVTRNVSSMALDTDYKAAAFMAIHTGLADADYEPMQQKDIGSGRDPEIYTAAGKALFVPQQAGDRADITRLLDRAYGLDQNEAEKVLASVERYQSSNMEKPQTRGYGFSYSPSR